MKTNLSLKLNAFPAIRPTPLSIFADIYISIPKLNSYNHDNPTNMANFTTSIQPPPGPNLTLPTPSNPHPPSNPSVFNDAMAVRQRVFIEEQHVDAEAEIDDDDARSWQWVLYAESDSNTNERANGTEGKESRRSKPVAVIRLVPPPHAPHEVVVQPEKTGAFPQYHLGHEPYIKLTRVAVLPEYRGGGVGRRVVDVAIDWARNHGAEIDGAYARVSGEGKRKPWDGLVLVHAQTEVEKMYTRLGFETDERLGRWDEEGIEHVGMWRRVSRA